MRRGNIFRLCIDLAIEFNLRAFFYFSTNVYWILVWYLLVDCSRAQFQNDFSIFLQNVSATEKWLIYYNSYHWVSLTGVIIYYYLFIDFVHSSIRWWILFQSTHLLTLSNVFFFVRFFFPLRYRSLLSLRLNITRLTLNTPDKFVQNTGLFLYLKHNYWIVCILYPNFFKNVSRRNCLLLRLGLSLSIL